MPVVTTDMGILGHSDRDNSESYDIGCHSHMIYGQDNRKVNEIIIIKRKKHKYVDQQQL